MRPSSLMASTSRCWASSSPRASEGEQTKDWFWDDFETVHLSDQLADLTGPKHMIAKPLLQTVKAVASDQEPDLQGPEAPARRNGPLGIISDRSACRLQVLGLDLERVELGRGSLRNWTEQSNCTPSHLWGLMTMLSQPSTRAQKSSRNSSQIIAAPAQAASRWV